MTKTDNPPSRRGRVENLNSLSFSYGLKTFSCLWFISKVHPATKLVLNKNDIKYLFPTLLEKLLVAMGSWKRGGVGIWNSRMVNRTSGWEWSFLFLPQPMLWGHWGTQNTFLQHLKPSSSGLKMGAEAIWTHEGTHYFKGIVSVSHEYKRILGDLEHKEE